MSMTTVPEPLSAGLMIISSRRIRRFRARLSRLVRLSRILFGLVLSSCSSIISNLSPTNVNISLNLRPVWRGLNFSVLRKRKRLDENQSRSQSPRYPSMKHGNDGGRES